MKDYLVVIEQDGDGRYVGEVPELKGCYSEGETLDELLANMKEAIVLCLDDEQEKAGTFVGIQRIVV
jgi:predicted RNase H-like HicB family nuclease